MQIAANPLNTATDSTAFELNANANFYDYRARYYDTSVGRFISEDRLGFSIDKNFYAYVSNNALNKIDPAGLGPYDWYEKARKQLKRGNCFLEFAACRLQEQVDALNSMTNDNITNTAIADQTNGGAGGDLGMQRVRICLKSDDNCRRALEDCLKLGLTNPLPPPSWLSDAMNYFSSNPSAPAPPIKHK